jgi:hypothetical protein
LTEADKTIYRCLPAACLLVLFSTSNRGVRLRDQPACLNSNISDKTVLAHPKFLTSIVKELCSGKPSSCTFTFDLEISARLAVVVIAQRFLFKAAQIVILQYDELN